METIPECTDMDLQDLATPIILFLAFVGFVTCLTRFLWVTLALTLGGAGYVSMDYPLNEATQANWLIAAAIAVGAFVLSRMFATPPPSKPEPVVRKATPEQPEIVIDGTNVMYWDGESADLSTLKSVIDALKRRGFGPWVFLDASSRHHLRDESLNERKFAKILGVPQNQVIVCPAQTEADAFLLEYAREHDLPVVSNDRFGDRPSMAKGLRLVKGVITNGKPILHGL